MKNQNDLTFNTIYPRAFVNIMAMLLLEGSLYLTLSISDEVILKYINVGLMIFILIYLIAIVKRRYFTKLNITLGTDYVISTSSKKYKVTDIECIYMNDNRIGIKLYGKRVVPNELCFYFQKNQESIGIRQLNEWAVRNNKSVKNKFFQTFL
ncbi:hypothetical protein NV379_23790 [Paenibacillus sp. N1-5-1-14]|uniref:hypothetical protein n=1 Tax=Paenibacillus radicibacter TaxID=2972488 RepID=UPI002159B47A|nr:hypothetical protein [Paenibacillus radicibacter]MCR8645667.1 hypothetical protein [Paenibacillus radicibacter]